jgi:chromate transporter
MTPRGWLVAGGVALAVLVVPLALAPVLAQLNLIFMKVDLMAFGGGFTTIPLIQHEVVDRFGWLSTHEFIDGIALGQVTPGPIVITATFVGYKAGGLLGALLGTIAVFFPSFVVLTTLAPHYDRIKRSRHVQVMVRGILAAFLGMLLLVAYHFGREALVDWRAWGLMAGAWLALWRKVDLLVVVGIGTVLSLFVFLLF